MTVSPSTPPRPVVLVAGPASTDDVAAFARTLGDDVAIRTCEGAHVVTALPGASALVIAGAAPVADADLAAAPELRVVVSLGGGPGVDVDAATRRGVLVAEPTSAADVSVAELAVGLMLAAARHICPAHAALRSGHLTRPAGSELSGKTVGLLGLDGSGVHAARILSGFGMRVLAHDPDARPGRAAQLGVRLVGLAELVATVDFLSVHLAGSPDTRDLLGTEELGAARPHLVLVDAVASGVVDHEALAAALREGRIAAAGLDVDNVDSPLLELDTVVATPRLGPLTREARQNAWLAAARSVRQALDGELVADAVNLWAGSAGPQVVPGIGLTERLGRILAALAGAPLTRIDVEVRGEIAEQDVTVLRLAALVGVLAGADTIGAGQARVSLVNAALLADESGLETRLSTDPESPDHRNLVTLRGTPADGTPEVSVGGTLVGIAQRERLVEVDGFDVDLEPDRHLVFLTYDDRPGMVGAVGAVLAETGVNIAGMQVARDRPGGRALMAMSVDSAVPPGSLARLVTAIGGGAVRSADLAR